MIFDMGAIHFLQHAVNKVRLLEQKTGRKFYLIAESDLNDPKVIKSPEIGGYGFDAQWLDDFHHALYVLLDKTGKERYGDFGKIEQLAKAYTDGFVHSGEMVRFRKRKYGASSAGIPGDKFIVFNQNHDQVGNRVKGERLSILVDFEHLKLAAAAMLLSPYIPLFFMGEEYGEDSPFFYFVSHSEKKLVDSVRAGRKKEFETFKWHVDPPDPQDEKTFNISKINWKKRFSGNHRILLEWNKKLISMRRSFKALQNTHKNDVRVYLSHELGYILHRKSANEDQNILCFFNFSDEELTFNIPSCSERWQKILDSGETKWNSVEQIGIWNFQTPDEIRAKQIITTYPCSVVVYKDKD
jgi:maltooligosyltrehalose trehalohydrolase